MVTTTFQRINIDHHIEAYNITLKTKQVVTPHVQNQQHQKK